MKKGIAITSAVLVGLVVLGYVYVQTGTVEEARQFGRLCGHVAHGVVYYVLPAGFLLVVARTFAQIFFSRKGEV